MKGYKLGRAIIITLDIDTPGRPGRSSQAFSTGVFDVISEGTRKHFRPEEAACARHCFFRLDEQFQEHMSLDEVHPACFNIFIRACEAGLADYQSTGITAWGTQHDPAMVQGIAWEWSEFIKKLHADPRYLASSAGAAKREVLEARTCASSSGLGASMNKLVDF